MLRAIGCACVGALLAACAGAPQPPRVDGEPLDAQVRHTGVTRQPVRAISVDVERLPSLGSSLGGPRSVFAGARDGGAPARADVAIRPMFFPSAGAGARPVEVVPDTPLGYVTIGGRTGWRGRTWPDRRPGVTAFCGAAPSTKPEPARWLTLRRARGPNDAIEVTFAEGSFDGKRCALVAADGGTVIAPVIDPSVPLYGFRACASPCGAGARASLVLVLPGLASLVMDAAESFVLEEGPFTVLRVALAGRSSGTMIGRVLEADARAFRDELELERAPDEAGPMEVTVEVTPGTSTAVVGVFVSAAAEVPERSSRRGARRD